MQAILSRLSPLAACLTLTACWVVPKEPDPKVDLGVAIASQYNHRGMVMNEKGVLQGAMGVELPTRTEGTLALDVWANMDLRNDTGDAWFPDGHAGRFSEIDLTATYSHALGPVDLDAGIENYNLPNGTEFPFGERGSTHELFLHASGEVLGARPFVHLRWDYDEAEGVYLLLGISEDFSITEGLTLELFGSFGYSSAGASFWTYGLKESGWSDLQGRIVLYYALDDATTIDLGVYGATIVDDSLQDWFDSIGIERDNVWVSLGVTHRF